MEAGSNYWYGLDATQAALFVFDHSKDLAQLGYINVAPALSEPASDTPEFTPDLLYSAKLRLTGPQTVVRGQHVDLMIQLSYPQIDYWSLPHTNAVIESSLDGGTWSTVATATNAGATGGSGVQVSVTPLVPTLYRAVVEGDWENAGATSDVITVRPVTSTSLSIHASASTVRRGHRVLYSGVIRPNMANGTHVVVEIRRSGSTTWKALATRHTFSSHHWSYSYLQGTRARGTYYVRARYAGNSRYVASKSASVKLVIR